MVNVEIHFSINSSHEPTIHRKLFSYQHGDWDNFRDLIRDFPLEHISNLDAEECAKDIASWLHMGIDAYIPSRKYQVNPHSSPWFCPAIVAAIAHQNHYFHFFHRNSSVETRCLFTRASNDCKRVIEVAKRSYQNKVHGLLVTQSIGSRDFWRINRSFSNRGKSLIPRSSMDLRLFPLLETRQNFLLSCSVVTPLLMILDTCCLTFHLGVTLTWLTSTYLTKWLQMLLLLFILLKLPALMKIL